jgi:pilus assembly protein CpaB
MFQRSPRALAFWAAAAIVAVITALVVASDLASLHRRAADLGPEVDAVVARHDLTVGHTISGADVQTRAVRRSQLPSGVLESAAAAVGRVVAVPVLRGQFVAVRHVASRHRSGLDTVVPRGMRAMRVVVTDALRPRVGAAVDVLATYEPNAATTKGTDTTEVIASGVLVLATDTRVGTGNGRAGGLGVTLLVDPDEATALADAQANGVLTLDVVPPEDAAH